MNVKTGKNFKIISLGVQKKDVYDLEVEENHNFFGNGILLHNSVFVDLSKIVEQKIPDDEKRIDAIDDFCNTLNDCIDTWLNELGMKMNSINNRLSMKREVISSVMLIRSKKNYAMKMLDKEGVRYETPKIKIMGLESVRSTTPSYLRDRLATGLTMMLNGCTRMELLAFVEKTKNDYMDNPNIEDLFFPKGTNDLEKFSDPVQIYKKGKSTPIHVRGALLYNKYFAGNEPIVSGESVRYTYLKMPNPISENVLSVIGDFPEEMRQYIDRQKNFSKLFESPIKTLAILQGWSMQRSRSFFDMQEEMI